MNQLLHCFDNADNYPKSPSLLHHQTYEHVLEAWKGRLDEREDDLCSAEGMAEVHLLECKDSQKPFVPHCVKTYDELRTYFGFKDGKPQPDEDPQSQFLFLHASNSRDRLRVTRKMLTALLTYYQVMPSFMDFVFPFGNTADARDFLFSGFRHETRLADHMRGLQVDQLSRSGRRLQVCYSLRSPAKTGAYENWAWSVQQTAIYHSLDFDNGRTMWLLVKGDPEVKDRVTSALRSANLKHLREFKTRDESFSTSLATHQLFSDWAGENWRWYINFLEKKVQEITDRTLNVTINRESVAANLRASALATNQISQGIQKSQTWTAGLRRALTFRKETTPILPIIQPPAAPTGRKLPPKLPPGVTKQQTKRDADEFDIDDIRMVERIEERTNEALLILKTQISVLSDLLTYYKNVLESEDAPKDMKKNCKSSVSRFQGSISGAISDLRLQQSRVETLLRLLADRKTLMNGIIGYQSMEASKWLAIKAQESSNKMEDMTRRMERIAEQTVKETVSMKVITVITLIFLPGTFVSTLMSTDIVKFQSNSPKQLYKVYSSGALYLFLEISLALMAVTVVVWIATNFGINWWQKRQWDKAEAKRKVSKSEA